MAIGSSVVSAFSGAADPSSFENLYTVSKVKTIISKPSKKDKKLNKIAQKIRQARNRDSDPGLLSSLFLELKEDHPENWILPLEILELANNEKFSLKIELYLMELTKKHANLKNLVESGISMVKSNL